MTRYAVATLILVGGLIAVAACGGSTPPAADASGASASAGTGAADMGDAAPSAAPDGG
jgi:hypothetical protein